MRSSATMLKMTPSEPGSRLPSLTLRALPFLAPPGPGPLRWEGGPGRGAQGRAYCVMPETARFALSRSMQPLVSVYW